MRRVVLAGFVVALIWPVAAFAHATLKSEEPGFRERFERAPARVVLRFDQGAEALPNSIVVYDAKGKVVSGAARNGKDTRARRSYPSTGSRAAPTPSAGTRCRATRTSSRASTPLASG